jgi:antitoxin (DNA-binding transcriptional repressor) of toxin-antitoxin stability system
VPSVASARGVSAKKLRIRTGSPPNALPRSVASHTQTSARGTLAEVSSGLPAPGVTPTSEDVAALLAAVRGGDERAIAAGAREHDVARLVAHEQRARDARGGRGQIDDAHAVGEVVHHPGFAVAARRDRNRLHPDRHGRRGA